MDAENVQTAGIVLIALGAFKLMDNFFKFLKDRKNNNKDSNKSLLTPEQTLQLKTLHDMHYQFDDDGAPKWFVPRSWGETQQKIAELLHDVAGTQEAQTEILKQIVDKLSK